MKRLLARHTFQYRLIHVITWELFFLGVILIYINWLINLHIMAYELIAGAIIILCNLALLKRTQNTVLCGHVISCICLVTMVLGNYWLGGLQTSYIGWFLVMPVIAAATLGLAGLMIYTMLSLAAVFTFYAYDVHPIYALPESMLFVMSFINLIFPLIIISSILYVFVRGYTHYENLLRKHNIILKEERLKYRYLSRYDALTNLPNRSYFQMQLESFLLDVDSNRNTFTLFFMDLDGLKETNDTYGHHAGDSLLLMAGKRLASTLRANDFLARLGGDEFTAIVHHAKESKVPEKLAQRILQEFQKPFNVNKNSLKCTISIGLAVYPQDGTTAETLLDAADKALYSVKNSGGNGYIYFIKIAEKENVV